MEPMEGTIEYFVLETQLFYQLLNLLMQLIYR